MTDSTEEEARSLAEQRRKSCEIVEASLDGTRLTLRGVGPLDLDEPGGGPRQGQVARSFVLRERDKTGERRFPVGEGADPDPSRFTVDLDLGSRSTLPPKETVWDAFVVAGSGDARVEHRVDASAAILPDAVTMQVRGHTYKVAPYTTIYGNLSVRVTPGPRVRRLDPQRRWVTRTVVKPMSRAAVRVAMRMLRVRDGRRARRNGGTASTHAVHILLLHAYGMGGTIRTVHNVAGYLSRDHDVTLYSVTRKVDEPFFPFPDGVSIVPLDDRTEQGRPRGVVGMVAGLLSRFPSIVVQMDDGASRSCTLWTDVQLVRTIRGLRSGVLVTTRPGLNLAAALFAPPEVITVGQEHMNFATHKAPLRKAIRRNYGKLDALAVLTETDRASYVDVLSSAPTRLIRIPNAVPRLDGGQADMSSKIVVAAGRLGNQKGFDLLIRAYVGVKARHPDWRLRIYGSGQWRDRLQRLIAASGLSGHVSLMGRASNMGEKLAEGSIYALSSRFEGFPMVLIEAMSKGLPVVAFDCPTGPAEVVVTGENGVLVERGDVDAFTAALNDLIEDADRRRACGAGARKTARDYELSVVGAQWDGLFEDLATPRTAGPARP